MRTTRLLLRPPCADDAASIFEGYAQDREVTRYLDWRPHASIAETVAFLIRCAEGWESGRDLTWALTIPPSDRVIGMIGLRPDGHKADFGYVLGREHWGKGLMTEAGGALVRAAFADPELFRLWATCDTANTASARVLEKLGLTREGTLHAWAVRSNIAPVPRDDFVYALVRP
jgi:RimJ/RimL family protein N-acetyltransferase